VTNFPVFALLFLLLMVCSFSLDGCALSGLHSQPLMFYMSSLSNASSVPHPRIQTPDEFSMGYVRFRVANGRYYWRNRRI